MIKSGTPPFRHGSGRLCLDFGRTLLQRGTPGESDLLSDSAALALWVGEFGPHGLDSTNSPNRVWLLEAKKLREAIFELLTAARSGTGAGFGRPAARQLVNRIAAHPVPVPRLTASGQLTWHADEPVAAVLALVARDAQILVGSDALDRVRNCANCQVLFFDDSRPGNRRWCSMSTCGNRAKKEALRNRVSARSPQKRPSQR